MGMISWTVLRWGHHTMIDIQRGLERDVENFPFCALDMHIGCDFYMPVQVSIGMLFFHSLVSCSCSSVSDIQDDAGCLSLQ
jgi:hypothetical protein